MSGDPPEFQLGMAESLSAMARTITEGQQAILRESLGGCAHAPLRHCGTVTWVFTFSNRLTMATKLK